MLFSFTEEKLEQIGGSYTLSEINQQPLIWSEVLALVTKRKAEISQFIKNSVGKNTKVIFTGAGTSEFAGSTIYPYLISQGIDAVSIPTTDIVTNIEQFINPNQKTLLVSFARSGNSPESVATFNMMQDYVTDLTHLVITCNAQGQLALKAQQDPKSLVILLPEAANDKSFAMTSSFTGMMLAAVLVLLIDNLNELSLLVKQAIELTSKVMNRDFEQLNKIAHLDHQRIVFLGSGVFKGLAQESHLKVLELSAGKVATFFNTPVGFRHGPKSILNHSTIAFFFLNADKYSRKYDLDLLKELATQHQLDKIVAIDSLNDEKVKALADFYFSIGAKTNNSFFNALTYITYAQLYAFNKALFLNNTPDNPWPSGLVNRVVEGVIIHQLNNVN